MLNPNDAINRKGLCEVFLIDTSKMSPAAISVRGAALRDKHDLKEYPDPKGGTGHLYSKKEAMGVWNKLQPITRKVAA